MIVVAYSTVVVVRISIVMLWKIKLLIQIRDLGSLKHSLVIILNTMTMFIIWARIAVMITIH